MRSPRKWLSRSTVVSAAGCRRLNALVTPARVPTVPSLDTRSMLLEFYR